MTKNGIARNKGARLVSSLFLAKFKRSLDTQGFYNTETTETTETRKYKIF